MTLACRRSWEAEAARDCRLAEGERASFEAHAQRCAVCSRERRRLAALAEALRASTPASDEVTLRRLRQSLLQRADAALRMQRGWGGRTWRSWQVAAAMAAAVALGAAVMWVRNGSRPVQAPPLVQITGQSAGALWTRTSSDHSESIHLGEGVFRLVVQRKPDDARVIVYVPEGRIEDIGTVFEVSVQHGRTARIYIERGSVLFHRNGLPTLRLDAGTAWWPEPEPTPAVTVPPADSAPPSAASLQPPRRVAKTARPHRHGGARPAASGAPEQAMPEEDLLYLRVLALLRDGRKGEAHLLAEEYLERFPNGFRRPEVEQIATQAAP